MKRLEAIKLFVAMAYETIQLNHESKCEMLWTYWSRKPVSRRWWIVSPTDNPTPTQSYPVRDLVTIFILAAIYAVAIGMIGGLTEIAGYPPYLSVAICIVIDLLCLCQLYGLVKNAFKRHNLATSLQRLQTANYE